MREILFKAKCIGSGDWIYGNLFVADNEECLIVQGNAIFHSCTLVDPETVCQFTGMTDKNGERIWEGDKMEFDAYGLHYLGDVRIIGGNACIWCENATPFLDDAVKRYGAIKTGNIHDKEGQA